VKEVLEKAIYEKGVVHADVFYLCGEANRRLGHLLIAEQMLLKCLAFEFHSPYTYASLGFLYRDLGNTQRACALFKRALDQQSGQSQLVAFELAKMIAKQGLLTESLMYFTKALLIAEEDHLVQAGE
jgi:tetratricopeptide (TPR) repeat protein